MSSIDSRSLLGFLADGLVRTIRSIRSIGLIHTTFAILRYLEDLRFDWRYGTDTAEKVSLSSLSVDSDNLGRATAYKASDIRLLMQILSSTFFPNGSVFVDIGAGKGKALLVAAGLPFKRVVGLEFSAELCDIARKNIAVFSKHVELTANIEIIQIDAVEYAIRSDENVFFLYNPFDGEVMGRFLTNLDRSLAEAPRKIWIIYNNPVHREVIESWLCYTRVQTVTGRDNEFFVYARNNG